MQITGDNLRLVLEALDRADSDVQNEIGMCSNVHEYADYLDDLKAEREDFAKLRTRVARAIERERVK